MCSNLDKPIKLSAKSQEFAKNLKNTHKKEEKKKTMKKMIIREREVPTLMGSVKGSQALRYLIIQPIKCMRVKRKMKSF